MDADTLQQLCESYAGRLDGGRLLAGLPIESARMVDDWIGPSLVWVPDSIQMNRPFYTVASSRMGRRPHRRETWFRLLERAIEANQTDGATMLVASESASAPWVRHACKLFRARMTEVKVARWGDAMERWLERLLRSPSKDCLLISPPVDGRRSTLPRRDVAVMALATRVFLPLVSRGGNIDQLARQRLTDARFDPASVWVAMDDEDREARDLIELGAVGWLCGCSPASNDLGGRVIVDEKIVTLDELLAGRRETGDETSWPYLTHCTRERVGRWPGQTEEGYRDELVLSRNLDPGAIGTLKRILRQQRLVGDHRVTRGDRAVVCFTHRTLSDLLHDRVYRSHLGRWDWEPYGIAIRRNVLVELGCREVVYGDDDRFASLPDAKKPFFQSEGKRHDWTSEREWRAVGSIDLSELASDDAFVFVATVDEALQIASLSRWPIVVTRV